MVSRKLPTVSFQFSERVACAQEGSCDEEGIDDGAHDAEDDGLVLKDVG